MKRNSRKKSYKELREDPLIWIPPLAWLLDRKALYISLTVAGCLVAGSFVYDGWKSYQTVIAPVEKPSAYLAIEAAQSPGSIWAGELLSDPRGIDGWAPRDSIQPSHGFLQSATGGTAGEVPITLLSTHLAAAGNTEALAQVYGAGQARRQYDFYVGKLSAIQPVDSRQVSDSGIFGATFDQGFLLTAGDTIVGIRAPDQATRDRLFGEYIAAMDETLPSSGCISLASVDGAKRSLYFEPTSFEGLRNYETIDTQVNTQYLPTVQGLTANEVGNPYAVVPESPLPASLPALPAAVEKPTIESAPALMDSFTAVADYQITDPVGPGCGWAWSAQNSLTYDEAALAAAKNKAVTDTQNAVNSSAQGYVDSEIRWARLVALLTPMLDNWNGYVNSVNSVHGAWDKLISDREALRPSWDTYIANHDSWFTFDGRKAAADQSYNSALTKCLADRKAHDDWELEWGPEPLKKKQDAWRAAQAALIPAPVPNPSPTATPTPTPTPPPVIPMPVAPPEPADCLVDPERPAILDEQKPQEPAAPELPADVTIPDSWPKPKS